MKIKRLLLVVTLIVSPLSYHLVLVLMKQKIELKQQK